VTPWYALFWKMSGGDNPGWTCVGLYEDEGQAREAFDRWDSVYDGLLVIARVDHIASRGVGQVFKDMGGKEGGTP
jgi:hypothetical protein